ncbi:MAG TPA: DUF6455 family protein [Stellaceae bacterium]|nr:DUF6455 family protein [Stellaceae bacterium]
MSAVLPAYVPPSQPLTALFVRLVERFGYWRERRHWLAELRRVAAFGRLDETLADIGIDRARLDVLANGPVDAGRQFEPMAKAAGADLIAIPPAVLRDAEWTCVLCEHRAACAHWLRSGEWEGGDTRCPNAALLHTA